MARRYAAVDEPEENKQLALELPAPVQRRRVVLDDDEDMATLLVPHQSPGSVGFMNVALRVPRKLAQELETLRKAQGVDADRKLEALMRQALEEFGGGGYTAWESKTAPPCTGFWDVKQRSARDGAAVRWWYGPVAYDQAWSWQDCTPSQSSKEAKGKITRIPHEVFVQSHAWRGMKKNWPLGYKYELRYPMAQQPKQRRRVEV